MLGVCGDSENTIIEVDHKMGERMIVELLTNQPSESMIFNLYAKQQMTLSVRFAKDVKRRISDGMQGI